MGAVLFQVYDIRKKYDINDPEQKIQFTMEVADVLAKLKNSIEQDVYTQQISEETGISKDAIRAEVIKKSKIFRDHSMKKTMGQKNRSRSEYSSNIQYDYKKEERNALYKAQKNLLYMIVNHPLIYKKIKDYLGPEEFIDPFLQRVAVLIYEKNEKGDPFQPASVINYFEDLEEQKRISNIFNTELEYSTEQVMEKAINDEIKLIKKTNIENRSRSSSDIYEIQSLIEQKKQLEKLYINIING
jgi:DNA primase